MSRKKIFIIYTFTIILGIIIPPIFLSNNILVLQVLLALLIYAFGYNFIHKKEILKKVYEQNDTNNIYSSNIKIKNALFHISDLFMNSINTDVEEVHKKVLEYAIEIIDDAESGSIAKVCDDDYLEFIASIGYDEDTIKKLRFRKENTFLWVNSKGKIFEPLIVRNVTEFNKINLTDKENEIIKKAHTQTLKSILTSPIYIDDKLVEILNVDSFNEKAFTEEDKKIINLFTSLIGIILKNKQLLERANFLSSHDKLTEIYNRRYFEDSFFKYQEKAFKENSPFSIVICDLNYLKKINDTFGHIAGDNALKNVVKAIKNGLKDSDVLARYGGDEFIILLSNSRKSDSELIMQSIFDSLDEYKLELSSTILPIQFSYGIAYAPDESIILDVLVKIADQRMYEHKKQLKEENKKDRRFDALTDTKIYN